MSYISTCIALLISSLALLALALFGLAVSISKVVLALAGQPLLFGGIIPVSLIPAFLALAWVSGSVFLQEWRVILQERRAIKRERFLL